ncbi:hypothetical protein [Spongiibacter tropicus]|uniref:hypothetical protein n=1 Tax=Spongiibacter tropicus TaxID=454602 RepID=UPI002353C52F|nr:hypothetical protein [Spongiibacter tropicus]|tara:strand:+ start:918 stop:2114 length:1197 start_codon:yes stop_codon:yes gene_type:complete
MLDFEIYAPISVPVSWQSERVVDNDQRYRLLKKRLAEFASVTVSENPWPMGYGSLEHDNFPLIYQPSAVVTIAGLSAESDVREACLYVYDNCLAVLYVRLSVVADLAEIDDLEITQRIEALSQQHVSPLLRALYRAKPEAPLIDPRAYRFFDSDEDALCHGKPHWVARMLSCAEALSPEHYLPWLQSVDEQSEYLLLGSGNSLLTDAAYFSDVHRIMVVAQFHAALMGRIEEMLKENLRRYNSNYYEEGEHTPLSAFFANQQYRNDHIEYINIQVSAAMAGVQGRRRELLQQFSAAWGFDAQRERLSQLTTLAQARLDRLLQNKLRQQNRSIQTLLAFLGSLGLVSLIVDLIAVGGEVSHDETVGLLDLIQAVSAEHLLGFTVIVVLFLTLYFYRNHE